MVDYDSDDDAQVRAEKEARTRVAREREFAAEILTPDAVAAAEGDTGVTHTGNTISEEALDRMLNDDDRDNGGGSSGDENKGGAAANVPAGETLNPKSF